MSIAPGGCAADDERVVNALDNARNGADRAARLTDQLLAFARRQPLRPQRHDLNQIVRQSAELFGRTLGEHDDHRDRV